MAGRIDELLRKLKGSAQLHIQVLRGEAELQELLNSHPKVISHTAGSGEAVVDFPGDDEDAAALRAEVVAAGVCVKGFYERRENLEDIFLKIGAHNVS